MNQPCDKIIATILGTASSGGVPRVGNNWGDCDPANPRNRRRRCSLLLTGTRSGMNGQTQVLIDTGADLREQLLSTDVHHLDAVLYTHAHADHTHGIDDLRALAISNRKRVDVYFSAETGARIKQAFGYCFEAPEGSSYPPILNAHEIEAGQRLDVDGPGGTMSLMPLLQAHGEITSLGYKIGHFVYSCDVSDFPGETLPQLENLDFWILDALRPVPHPSHLSLDQALDWVARMRPKAAALTNLHVDMDYATVAAKTPAHVQPAFDGMRIDVLTGKVLKA